MAAFTAISTSVPLRAPRHSSKVEPWVGRMQGFRSLEDDRDPHLQRAARFRQDERHLSCGVRLPVEVGLLRLRDRTCRFPGCAATRHLHAHHVEHWVDGGPTDLDNLVLLCGAHHRFVHCHDWLVEAAARWRLDRAAARGDPADALGATDAVTHGRRFRGSAAST